MIVIFVHGWSVTHTNTYGELPQWLENQSKQGKLDIQVGNIYLGRYISFDDTVTVDDIARAFDQAVRDEIAAKVKMGSVLLVSLTLLVDLLSANGWIYTLKIILQNVR